MKGTKYTKNKKKFFLLILFILNDRQLYLHGICLEWLVQAFISLLFRKYICNYINFILSNNYVRIFIDIFILENIHFNYYYYFVFISPAFF